jgi:DNA-binding transcriptional MerR regulator
MKRLFPIEELRRLAAVALDLSDYEPAESGRVRAIPDVRTIRYYTTIGLIDRPAEMQGRTAFYGLRHVEQVVAIKRLQARGLTLSDIQHELVGLTAGKLSRLADLPDGFEKLSGKITSIAMANQERAPSRMPEPEPEFWKRMPQPARGNPSTTMNSIAVTRVLRIQLDGNTSIEINTAQADVDIGKIRSAAQPLIDELKRQRLTRSDNSNPSEVNDE